MKMHTTNYINTLIEIADDCPVSASEVPPLKGDNKSVANLQFEMLNGNPYKFTSDDIMFSVFATRKELPKKHSMEKREEFFSKGQPCFRASPLAKRYGFGVHSNPDGKVAIYGVETQEYDRLMKDGMIKKVKAMRSKRS